MENNKLLEASKNFLEALDAYGRITIGDLFGNDENFIKAEQSLRQVIEDCENESK